MKKIFTLFIFSAFVFTSFAANDPVLMRPDSAYASSMYLDAEGKGALIPMFLITPALPEVTMHPEADYADIQINALSEESATATHPISVGGDVAFGAWHSFPSTKVHPWTGEAYSVPVEDQWVVLTFNEAVDLNEILIWNIHQVNGGNPSNNEVKDFTVEVTADTTGAWTEVLADYLEENTDAEVPVSAQTFALENAKGVRFVRINVDSNYGHAKNAGLAEVRFMGQIAEDTNSSSNMNNSKIKVYQNTDRALVISEAEVGAAYTIYNLQGSKIASGLIENNSNQIEVNEKGIFVVSIAQNGSMVNRKVWIK